MSKSVKQINQFDIDKYCENVYATAKVLIIEHFSRYNIKIYPIKKIVTASYTKKKKKKSAK